MKTTTHTWSLSDLPDQTGRTFLITGTTVGGLGHYTALELARRGARVVLAGRTQAKLDDTDAAIREQVAKADLSSLVVDVSDQSSVRRAAEQAAGLGAIDVLINNAGIMGTPYAASTDGVEMQMATNHYGPFLLTGLLLPQLAASGDGRVVAVSSQMHRVARKAPLHDPRRGSHGYSRWPVYSESKLANLLFTYELERRLTAAGLPVKALAAHPGFSGTHLAANGRYGSVAGGKASILDATVKAIAQSAHAGSLPTLMAATDDLPGGTYCGPSGPFQYAGLPKVVGSTRLARNENAQKALWELSETVTGISYP